MRNSHRTFDEVTQALRIRKPILHMYHATVNRGWFRYREALRKFYAPLLEDARLIFDIGANRGFFASVFASFGARVVAIEPNPDCVRHIELSYPEIEVIQAVAGDKSGLANLHLSDECDVMSSLSEEWIATIRAHNRGCDVWKRTLVVPMVRLDSLIEHYGVPDYVKIDVEGFEENVLDGLSVCPNLLSFEYNLALLDAAFRCLDKPIFDGARFNFKDDHSDGFFFPQWTDAANVKSELSKFDPAHMTGNIFVAASVRLTPAGGVKETNSNAPCRVVTLPRLAACIIDFAT